MDTDEKTTGGKRSGQPANQNARRHGFYSKVLDEEERAAYEKAIQVEGLDEEIALLRVKLMFLIRRDPDNLRLITQAINSLVRLVVMKYHLNKGDTQTIAESVKNVLRDVALPIGITIASSIAKLR